MSASAVAALSSEPSPPGDVQESELVERVRRGDPAAFDLLVSRHLQRAFSVAYRLLGQREDAEDLVQEAFLTVLEKIDTFQAGRSFAPWFYRILVNRGLNARKSRSLRHTEELPAEVPSPHGGSPLRSRCARRLAAPHAGRPSEWVVRPRRGGRAAP